MPRFYCEDTAIPDTEDLEMLAKRFSQQVAVFTRMTKILPLKTRKCVNVTFFIITQLNYISETWHFCNKSATAKQESVRIGNSMICSDISKL